MCIDSDHDEVVNTTITLGELRRRLADFDPFGVIQGVTADHTSYRGDYSNLALIPGRQVKLITLRKYLRSIDGRSMTGWKGGTFPIHDGVLVHLAHEGDTGPRIVGVSDSCRLIVQEDYR